MKPWLFDWDLWPIRIFRESQRPVIIKVRVEHNVGRGIYLGLEPLRPGDVTNVREKGWVA